MKKGYLKFPELQDEESMKMLIQTMKDENNPFGINGAGAYESCDTYQQWLTREKKNHLGIELKDGFVPSTELLYIFNNKVIGCINIRHCLNDALLRHGGHIGYSIHPDYRRQGHATAMVQEALKFCQQWEINPVLITCHKDNVASRKTIEKCGGQFDSQCDDILRFWIGGKEK
ncbi:GNAT family N-acetyltransferase [Allocoprobacillus halotolerans]|uniref:GNAT family N-acetyltransferase n=1 Tax=Allocoprobacillus halotolerans TaxID=2944914 RepID=A0ABY5HYN5_9FIRM|nr:GNAT family N-acetyltransferase [Allocoprobacillus halotolerans]UTY38201.1 GNAT family N-acetyltransferase [Allocoprobacillus halotolerans]